jgi:hypothetical protein
MKLDDIINSWKTDCKIDKTDLANESLKTPILHAKYYEWYTRENLLAIQTEHEYRKLYKTKTLYYCGKLTQDELDELGWAQHDLLVIKQDLDKYIDADDDIIKILLKLALQKEKVDALKEIIKCLHSRPFAIKSAIDFLKFESGF